MVRAAERPRERGRVADRAQSWFSRGDGGGSGVLPADMVGGVSTARAANLEVAGEALSAFVKRVDGVLSDLDGSPGNPKRVGAQTIKPDSLNSGSADAFPEAHGLYLEYNRVHEKLTSLSTVLHLQIEAIGIAVRGAHVGFANLEEEQRRRFWAIQTQIETAQGGTGPKGVKGAIGTSAANAAERGTPSAVGDGNGGGM